MYKYAIVGFGGLGKLHLSNLEKLAEQRGDFKLVAICGADKSSFQKNIKINLGEIDLSSIDFGDCNFYNDYKELIEKENLDFVISTLPTYLHEEFASYALSNGLHVFSEKPMALSVDGCRNMIKAANENNKKLMIGHCLRFDGAYSLLKDYIDNNTFGKAYRAEFTRYSQLPVWSWDNWLLDPKRSGGCVLDMHIHDVDLINWYFGKPKSLRSVTTQKKTELESVFTQYFYNDLFVISNADWSMPQTFPFEAKCIINFEKATVVLTDGKITVHKDDETFCPEINDEHYFMAEMRSFLDYVICDIECEKTSVQSICDSVSIALSEIESASKGITICF